MHIYWVVTSCISFYWLMRHPTRMNNFDNFIGSIIAALLLGWLLWPFFAVAHWKVKSH